MNRYRYEAVNAQEVVISGEIVAESVLAAVAQLEAQGLALRAIERLEESSGGGAEAPPEQENIAEIPIQLASATAEQAALHEHWERVFERAKDILPALRAYAHDMPSGRRRRQLYQVLQILERGNAHEATAALATLPGYWIPLLSAAATSQDPGRVLREFLEESHRAEDLYRQWWLALAYPVCLLVIAGVVLVALSLLVVPIFSTMFDEFQLQLPLITRVVVAVAEWIVTGRILVMLALGVATCVLLWLVWRCLPTSLHDWIGDRWPLSLGRSTALARFSQFTADLLEAELSPPQAVQLAGLAVRNGSIQRAARRSSQAWERGASALSQENTRVLSHTILSVLDGSLPRPSQTHLLREIGACYGDRVQLRLSWTRGIVEPIAICLVGLLVGVTVLALFMPLIRLLTGLAG